MSVKRKSSRTKSNGFAPVKTMLIERPAKVEKVESKKNIELPNEFETNNKLLQKETLYLEDSVKSESIVVIEQSEVLTATTITTKTKWKFIEKLLVVYIILLAVSLL